MAIQFDCVACGKRVEIDDAWGGRLVECPYCHDTITAPAYSTVPMHPDAPVAPEEPSNTASIGPAPDLPAPDPHAPDPHVESPWSATPTTATWAPPQNVPANRPTNKLAVVALVLACAAVLLGLASTIPIIGAVTRELGTNATAEQMNAYLEKAAESGAPWVVKSVLIMLGAFGLWVAGVVCGILAIRKPVWRGVSIAALVILGLPLAMVTLSLLAA
jgi:hypothetical protein